MGRWERSIWVLLVLASANIAHAQPTRGYLGIHGEDIQQGDRKGAVIREVAPGGPANKAGIKVGDQVIGLGDEEVTSFEDLRIRMGTYKPGDKINLKVLREDKEVAVEVTLETPPAPPLGPIQRGFRFRIPADREPGQDLGLPDAEEMVKPQPMVGIQLQPIDDALRERLKLADRQGILVSEVTPDGPAAKAGIKAEDLIVAVEGKTITDPAEMRELIQSKKKGDVVNFRLVRAGEEIEKQVEVDERPMVNLPFDRGEPGSLGAFMEPRLEGLQRRLAELEDRLKEGSRAGLDELGERLRQLELQAQAKVADRVDALEKKIGNLEQKVQETNSEAVERLQRMVDELSKKVDALASPK